MNSRRSSRSSKYHQQYLGFLRRWKNFIRGSQYEQCEALCLDHIDNVTKTIQRSNKYSSKKGGPDPFVDIKNLRSKVRNLYAVLLHDYLKRHDDALEQYELCVEDDPYNASAHYNWAILHKNYYKDYHAAEVHYKKAIELKPRHAAYHNNYGLLLEQQLHNYGEARKKFQRALELDPSNGRAHTNMANLLKKHYKDYEAASYHYKKAIEMDPENPIRHFNYALFLKHSLRDYEGAGDEYEEAIRLDPNYEQALHEYKNFLLHESPFNRKRPKGKHRTHEEEHEAKRNHAARCVRHCVKFLFDKRTSEARELLNMALRCNPLNRFALFLSDPRCEPNDMHDMDPQQLLQDVDHYQNVVTHKNQDIIRLQQQLDRFQSRVSTISTTLKNGEVTQDSEAVWSITQLDRLNNEMVMELTRLQNEITEIHEDEESMDIEDSKSGGSASLYRPGRGLQQAKKGHRTFLSQNPPFRKRRRGSASKRHSLKSVASSIASAQDYGAHVLDFHKKSLMNIAMGLSKLKDSLGGMQQKHAEDLHDSLTSTMRSLEMLDLAQGSGFVALGALGGPGHLGVDDTRTVGGMSTVSATTSHVMEQRRDFLKEAAKDPEVSQEQRAVSKWLTNTYLKSEKRNVPLSQHSFPNISENASDTEDEFADSRTHDEEMPASTRELRTFNKIHKVGSTPKVLSYLDKVTTWDFDVFGMTNTCGPWAMAIIFLAICRKRGLTEALDLNETAACNFFVQIAQQYLNNPYHNHVHGCDVLVNTNYFMSARIFEEFRPLDIFASLIASACHDVGHPGHNNAFEVAMENPIAVTYNDSAVLENHHIALSWRTLQKQGCNIMSGFTAADRRHCRKLMIDAILATDMSKHMPQQVILGELIDDLTNAGVNFREWAGKSERSLQDIDDDFSDNESQALSVKPSVYDDKVKLATVLVPLAVHTADLSNPAKPTQLYTQWASRVMEEFWSQGDKEKENGLPVTHICNRDVMDLPTCQTGFINHVIRPWFDLWGKLLVDKTHGPSFMEHVNSNFTLMQEKASKLKAEKQRLEEEKQRQAQESDVEEEKASQVSSPNSRESSRARGLSSPVQRSVSNRVVGQNMKPPMPGRTVSAANVNGERSGPRERKKKSLSVVGLSFEEIAKVQMAKQMKQLEELRKQQEALDEAVEVDGDLSSLKYQKGNRASQQRINGSRYASSQRSASEEDQDYLAEPHAQSKRSSFPRPHMPNIPETNIL